MRLVGREAGVSGLLEAMPREVRAQVEMGGFVEPEKLPAEFAAADVFVLPSRHDGWGVVVPQAMAAGLPVISTPATRAAAELVTSGRHGLLVPACDVPALAEAMSLLDRDVAMRMSMGREAREMVRGLTPQATAHAMAMLAREAWRVFHQGACGS